MTRESEVQLSMEMALALPITRMVVFVQRDTRIEWEIWAEISRMPVWLSKFSMSHLFPSSSFRGGFFVRMLSGLGFLPGKWDLLEEDDV